MIAFCDVITKLGFTPVLLPHSRPLISMLSNLAVMAIRAQLLSG
jgi:hypothetical protein